MSDDNKVFELGDKLRDRVSGFTGIAMAIIEFYNGCVRYMLEPETDKDGKLVEACYIDVQQLEKVDDGLNKKQERAKQNTGGSVNPTEQSIPRQ